MNLRQAVEALGKKMTNVQLYPVLTNGAVSETRKALNKHIFEKQTSSARVVYAKQDT